MRDHRSQSSPLGVPIEDLIARLPAVQADHPGAQIRQGNAIAWKSGHPSTHPADNRPVHNTPPSTTARFAADEFKLSVEG